MSVLTDYCNIPQELKERKRWVIVGPQDKYPRQLNGIMASVSNPDTWTYYDDALEAAEISGCYLGYVFRDGDGYVGIDIDDGFDEHGEITVIADDIIRKCCSYTEISRSGRGFHVILKGDIPFKGKNNRAGVEIYKDARYFILTGSFSSLMPIMPKNIHSVYGAIPYVLDKYFHETVAERNKTDKQSSRIYTPEWEHPNGNRVKLRPMYPRIPNGCRNICLTSLAGMMHNIGYDADKIYAEIVYANETACDPVLDDEELRSIVRSVRRYKR